MDWIGAGALSFGMAALVFTYSILTVQADTHPTLFNPCAGVPESTLTPAVVSRPTAPFLLRHLRELPLGTGCVSRGIALRAASTFEMLH